MTKRNVFILSAFILCIIIALIVGITTMILTYDTSSFLCSMSFFDMIIECASYTAVYIYLIKVPTIFKKEPPVVKTTVKPLIKN